MNRRDELEARVAELARKLVEVHGDNADTRWQLAAALIHQAVHVAFCKVTGYLAEMINHAHKLMHGDDKTKEDPHKDVLH
jgi:hypothetical protein